MTISLLRTVYAAPGVGTSIAPTVGTFSTLSDIFGWILNIILGVGWALCFIMIAIGFIQYILSKGEAKATQAAQQWITYAGVGGVGLLFLTVVKTIIGGLTGNNISQNTITNFLP